MENIESRIDDIAIGLSVPSEKIKLVYENVKSKGIMQGDDLRQLTEIGMPMVKELSALYGKNTTEIKSMVQNGEIDFKHFGSVFLCLTNEGGMFYELKKKQSQTWGYQYKEALKKLIIEAYNAGYSNCENKIGTYSAEDYYNDTFEKNKSLN
ncbi:MAG: tape measure protein [Myroides sp.]